MGTIGGEARRLPRDNRRPVGNGVDSETLDAMPEASFADSPEHDGADLIGRTIGDYAVLRQVGAGAMAFVYLARQKSLDRPVALKVLKPSLAQDAAYLERFRSEARSAAALVHSNIVSIFEVGCVDGLHFIAQEFVPGATLGQILQQQGPLPSRLIVQIMAQVAGALVRAAESGVVHRDIKPDNVMFSAEGEVKVTDFGLARDFTRQSDLTQIGMTMGTPLYMSPEQVEGGRLDARSDLYSLGATAYHLLSGEPPFTAETALGVAVKHLREPHRPTIEAAPDAESELCEIIDRLLEKSPERRFSAPKDLVRRLKELPWAWDESDVDDAWTKLRASLADAVPRMNLAATQQLQAAMNSRRGRWRWRFVVGGLLTAVAAGVVAARLMHQSTVLRELNAAVAPRKEDAWAQLLYAKLRDVPEAWRSVGAYFPNSEVPRYLAQLGLGDRYLKDGEFRRAYLAYRELSTAADDSYRDLGHAMCYVAAARQGRRGAAETHAAAIVDENRLQSTFSQRGEQFNEARASLGAPPAAPSTTQ